MLCIISSNEFHAAGWALHHHFWTFCFNMIEKLCPCQMLELFLIAYIATEFWTVIDSMLLKFKKCFPNNASILSVFKIAFMRKFTKINAISKNLINFLQKVASFLTIWTANIVSVWPFSNKFIVRMSSSCNSATCLL